MTNKFDVLQTETEKIKRENAVLKKENTELIAELKAHEIRINDLERDARRKKLRIHGLRETEWKAKIKKSWRSFRYNLRREMTKKWRIGRKVKSKKRSMIMELKVRNTQSNTKIEGNKYTFRWGLYRGSTGVEKNTSKSFERSKRKWS